MNEPTPLLSLAALGNSTRPQARHPHNPRCLFARPTIAASDAASSGVGRRTWISICSLLPCRCVAAIAERTLQPPLRLGGTLLGVLLVDDTRDTVQHGRRER